MVFCLLCNTLENNLRLKEEHICFDIPRIYNFFQFAETFHYLALNLRQNTKEPPLNDYTAN